MLPIERVDRVLNEDTHQFLQAVTADGFHRLTFVAAARRLLALELLEYLFDVLLGLAVFCRPLQEESQERVFARVGGGVGDHTNRIPGRFPVCQPGYAGRRASGA